MEFLLVDLGFGWSRNLITVDDRRCRRDRDRWVKENALAHRQDRPFSCPFSAPAILYRPLAPRTGRGLMEIYDSHLIGFNVPRISSSRNASSDFFRTVCSFRALTTSAIKTYTLAVCSRAPISMGPRRVSYGELALSPSHAAKAKSVLKAHEKSGKCLPRHWVYYSSKKNGSAKLNSPARDLYSTVLMSTRLKKYQTYRA